MRKSSLLFDTLDAVMRLLSLLFLGALMSAQPGQKWVASWAASAHGPYPIGNASAQPNPRFAFPDPPAGARDQTFRLIVQPDLWGRQTRLHFSNVFGVKPVTFDGVFAGLHLDGGAVVAGTNRAVHFGGKPAVTIPAPPGRRWKPSAGPTGRRSTPMSGEPATRRKRPAI